MSASAQTKIGDLKLSAGLDVAKKVTSGSFCFRGGSCFSISGAGGSGGGGGNAVGTPGYLVRFKKYAILKRWSMPASDLNDALGDSVVYETADEKFGIWTKNPQAKLHVVARDNFDAVRGGNNNTNSDMAGQPGLTGIGTIGVLGQSNAVTPGFSGIFGDDGTNFLTSGTYGVFGLSSSRNGTGVLGEASGQSASAGLFEYIYVPDESRSSASGFKELTGHALRATGGPTYIDGRLGVGYDPNDTSWPASVAIKSRGNFGATFFCNEDGTDCIDIAKLKLAVLKCGTCGDGIKNGDETDVDIGGSCGFPPSTLSVAAWFLSQ